MKRQLNARKVQQAIMGAGEQDLNVVDMIPDVSWLARCKAPTNWREEAERDTGTVQTPSPSLPTQATFLFWQLPTCANAGKDE